MFDIGFTELLLVGLVALMVLGPDAGMAFAERNGIAAFFVTREGEGFVTQGTTAFEQLFAAGDEQ